MRNAGKSACSCVLWASRSASRRGFVSASFCCTEQRGHGGITFWGGHCGENLFRWLLEGRSWIAMLLEKYQERPALWFQTFTCFTPCACAPLSPSSEWHYAWALILPHKDAWCTSYCPAHQNTSPRKLMFFVVWYLTTTKGTKMMKGEFFLREYLASRITLWLWMRDTATFWLSNHSIRLVLDILWRRKHRMYS